MDESSEGGGGRRKSPRPPDGCETRRAQLVAIADQFYAARQDFDPMARLERASHLVFNKSFKSLTCDEVEKLYRAALVIVGAIGNLEPK